MLKVIVSVTALPLALALRIASRNEPAVGLALFPLSVAVVTTKLAADAVGSNCFQTFEGSISQLREDTARSDNVRRRAAPAPRDFE
jgi:hypothetical protein